MGRWGNAGGPWKRGIRRLGELYSAIFTPSEYQYEVREDLHEAIELTKGGDLGGKIAEIFRQLLEEEQAH